MLLFYAFIFLICTIFIILCLRHFVICRAVCKSSASMADKVVVITGGNSGIGKYTAIDLARRGAKVYIASEVSITVGEAAAKEIQLESGSSSVHFCRVDLASMKSVKEFAQHILEQESQIHVLVNNAGVYLYNKRLTEDGFDATIAINYVGHYLLTLLLLERIKNSASSRIIVMTSVTQYLGSLDFTDMMLTKHDNALRALMAYSRSKLALLMFARELGRKLLGTGMTVCAVDPGYVDTAIITNTQPILFKAVLYAMKKLIFVSPHQGAQTSIHCAVSQEVEGDSGYYINCKKENPTTYALNDKLCVKLWEYSFNLVKPYLEETTETVFMQSIVY